MQKEVRAHVSRETVIERERKKRERARDKEIDRYIYI